LKDAAQQVPLIYGRRENQENNPPSSGWVLGEADEVDVCWCSKEAGVEAGGGRRLEE
jgi:hypothetical protein